MAYKKEFTATLEQIGVSGTGINLSFYNGEKPAFTIFAQEGLKIQECPDTKKAYKITIEEVIE